MTTTQHFIGRTDSGSRVFVTIQVQQQRGIFTTTSHTQVTDPLRMSITGTVVAKGRRSTSVSGQVSYALDRITRPAPGWTMNDVGALASLWKTHHLNNLRAGCEHMDFTGLGRDYDSRKHLVCPETGYRYGHAWLVKPIPREALDVAWRLQSLPTGNVPAYV